MFDKHEYRIKNIADKYNYDKYGLNLYLTNGQTGASRGGLAGICPFPKYFFFK